MAESTKPTRIRAARKTHTCDWCGELIVVGESYTRWRYFDAGASTVKLHEDCFDAMSELGGSQEWNAGDNRRGCNCGRSVDCERCVVSA